VDNILTNTLLPEVSRQLLEQLAEGTKVATIRVGLDAEGSFVYDFTDPGSVVTTAASA